MAKDKTGQTDKFKAILAPYLDNLIVYNRLTFIESKKYTNGKKALYLVFGAFNNALNEEQKVVFEPKTGYVHVTLHHNIIKP